MYLLWVNALRISKLAASNIIFNQLAYNFIPYQVRKRQNQKRNLVCLKLIHREDKSNISMNTFWIQNSEVLLQLYCFLNFKYLSSSVFYEMSKKEVVVCTLTSDNITPFMIMSFYSYFYVTRILFLDWIRNTHSFLIMIYVQFL